MEAIRKNLISIRHEANNIDVVTFNDNKLGIDLNLQQLKQELHDLIGQKTNPKIILCLRDLAYVSSGPLAIISKFYDSVKAIGGVVKFCCVDNYILDGMQVFNLHRAFDIYPTEEEAIHSFEDELVSKKPSSKNPKSCS